MDTEDKIIIAEYGELASFFSKEPIFTTFKFNSWSDISLQVALKACDNIKLQSRIDS
jgi:hypothetical protein